MEFPKNLLDDLLKENTDLGWIFRVCAQFSILKNMLNKTVRLE